MALGCVKMLVEGRGAGEFKAIVRDSQFQNVHEDNSKTSAYALEAEFRVEATL
jgi:hypothetical protein